MSAARRAGSKRGGGGTDFFGTPSWCVDRLLETWQPIPGPLVEPGAGQGAIIRAFEAFRPWPWAHTWHAIEIKPNAEAALMASATHVVVEIGDFLDEKRVARPIVTSVIGNPPYRLAEEFIRQARRCYPRADIAFLLRVNFLASENRADLWREVGVPDVFVLPNRPQFGVNKHGKKGADATEYAWMVFRARHDGAAVRTVGYVKILATTPLEDRRG